MSERGAATTEIVLVMPAALFMVMMVFQFVLWYNARELVVAAAQDGAAAGRVERGDAAAARERADALLTRGRPALDAPARVSVERGADQIRVEVRGRVVTLVPGVNLDVHGVSSAPIERFVPMGDR